LAAGLAFLRVKRMSASVHPINTSDQLGPRVDAWPGASRFQREAHQAMARPPAHGRKDHAAMG
jgi:hypothetical protein